MRGEFLARFSFIIAIPRMSYPDWPIATDGRVSDSFDVQFVSSRRDENGQPYRWVHGPYSWESAVAHSRLMHDYFESDEYRRHHKETGLDHEAPSVAVSIIKTRRRVIE